MATKLEVFYTKHQAGLTMIINGVPAVVYRTNPHYAQIEADLKAGRYDSVVALSNIKQTVQKAIVESGESRISIKNGQIYWTNARGQSEEVRGPLVDRIVGTVRSGSTANAIQPLVRLLSNISRNKKKDIRDELYEFLTSGRMPITVDGCFLAYKKVRSNFKDIHSGKFDNSPGKLVAMPADEVDTNRNNECSRGLHFCSRGYLTHFGDSSSRTIIVKVNPRHVYAIPRDYNCAKGRASEYYVVGTVTGDPIKDEMFLQPFVYNENLKDAAPQVKFIGEGKKGVTVDHLKASLKTMAEGYGLSSGGKAFVRVADTKGALHIDKYTIVYMDSGKYISAITKKEVPAEHVSELSIQTKSVRSALVRAVARRRGRG